MNAFLNRTRTVISDCEEHLKAMDMPGSPVESYLTQHILVVLCADVQEEIYKIVEEKSNNVPDVQVENFVNSATRKVFRSVMKRDISKLLEMFGPECKDALNESVNESIIGLYNNAVVNRHNIAHKQGAQVTFSETVKATDAAAALLGFIKNVLLRGSEQD